MKTYWRGDEGDYTGETKQMHGATFHAIRMREGPKAGQVVWTQYGPGEHAKPDASLKGPKKVPQLDGRGKPKAEALVGRIEAEEAAKSHPDVLAAKDKLAAAKKTADAKYKASLKAGHKDPKTYKEWKRAQADYHDVGVEYYTAKAQHADTPRKKKTAMEYADLNRGYAATHRKDAGD